MLESKIEKTVCEYAKGLGVLTYKFTGHKGVPDRIFMINGKTFFIEFKAEGKKPTQLQRKTMMDIVNHKIPCYVCDTIESGKMVIDSFAHR